ncbi:unnamed protein product, partial [Ectocarpus sp. 12 AP-2014]
PVSAVRRQPDPAHHARHPAQALVLPPRGEAILSPGKLCVAQASARCPYPCPRGKAELHQPKAARLVATILSGHPDGTGGGGCHGAVGGHGPALGRAAAAP